MSDTYYDGYRDGWHSVLRNITPPSPPRHIPPSEHMLYDSGYERGRSDAIAGLSTSKSAAS